MTKHLPMKEMITMEWGRRVSIILKPELNTRDKCEATTTMSTLLITRSFIIVNWCLTWNNQRLYKYTTAEDRAFSNLTPEKWKRFRVNTNWKLQRERKADFWGWLGNMKIPEIYILTIHLKIHLEDLQQYPKKICPEQTRQSKRNRNPA